MTQAPYALITGSTRGIGLSTAMELAEHGFIPILNYRADEEAAEQALTRVQRVCEKAHIIQADVTTESGVQSLFEAASRCGRVEVLINNVGQFLYKPFLNTSVSEWHKILDSNLTSTVSLYPSGLC